MTLFDTAIREQALEAVAPESDSGQLIETLFPEMREYAVWLLDLICNGDGSLLQELMTKGQQVNVLLSHFGDERTSRDCIFFCAGVFYGEAQGTRSREFRHGYRALNGLTRGRENHYGTSADLESRRKKWLKQYLDIATENTDRLSHRKICNRIAVEAGVCTRTVERALNRKLAN
jgi:hypothetical protein